MARTPAVAKINETPPAEKPKASKPAGVEVTYVPGEGDPVSVEWNKLKFEANKPRLVSDDRIIERAKRNPWFRVEGSKAAAKGFDPANDKPVSAEQYRAYAITWIKLSTASAAMTQRWSDEEAMRAELGVGTDDLEYIARHYDPHLESLTKAEAEA